MNMLALHYATTLTIHMKSIFCCVYYYCVTAYHCYHHYHYYLYYYYY